MLTRLQTMRVQEHAVAFFFFSIGIFYNFANSVLSLVYRSAFQTLPVSLQNFHTCYLEALYDKPKPTLVCI